MLNIRFLILLALAFTCCIASDSSCANKNPYLRLLDRNGVQILNSVTFGSEVCNPEWATYGTCCETQSAREFGTREMNMIKQHTIEILQESEQMSKSLKNLLEFFGHLNSSLSGSSTGHEGEDLHGSRAELLTLSDQIRPTAIYLLDLLAHLPSQQSRCSKKISQVRSLAVCYICSGRSQQFFLGKNMAMSENTCRAILDECEENWVTILEIVRLIKEIELYYPHLKELVHQNKNWPKFDDAFLVLKKRKIESWSKDHKLDSYLKECNRNIRSCSFKTIGTLCHSLVHVMKDIEVKQVKHRAESRSLFVDSSDVFSKYNDKSNIYSLPLLDEDTNKKPGVTILRRNECGKTISRNLRLVIGWHLGRLRRFSIYSHHHYNPHYTYAARLRRLEKLRKIIERRRAIAAKRLQRYNSRILGRRSRNKRYGRRKHGKRSSRKRNRNKNGKRQSNKRRNKKSKSQTRRSSKKRGGTRKGKSKRQGKRSSKKHGSRNTKKYSNKKYKHYIHLFSC